MWECCRKEWFIDMNVNTWFIDRISMFAERSDIYICMLEYIVWSPTCIV